MGFCWNCGAHLRFLSAPESQEHRDLIIFVIGSNDLGDGISQSSIYSQLKGYINGPTNLNFNEALGFSFLNICTYPVVAVIRTLELDQKVV